jgi:hypothetical protein
VFNDLMSFYFDQSSQLKGKANCQNLKWKISNKYTVNDKRILTDNITPIANLIEYNTM